jgi:hypothetical protein
VAQLLADQAEPHLFPYGSRLTAAVSETQIKLSTRVRAAEATPALTPLFDLLARPTWTAVALDRARAQLADPVMEKITLSQCIAAHAARFSRRDLLVSLTGPVDDRLVEQVRSLASALAVAAASLGQPSR